MLGRHTKSTIKPCGGKEEKKVEITGPVEGECGRRGRN